MPAGLAIDAGRYSLAVIFVAFVVVGFLALSLAEVSSRYDVTGGPQVYAQRVFGPATVSPSAGCSPSRGLPLTR